MPLRGKPYKIQLSASKGACHVSRQRFQQCLKLGLIVLLAESVRVASVVAGVQAWLEEGQLHLFDPKTQAEVSIPSSWRLVDQAAKYDHRWTADELTRRRWVQDEEIKTRVIERRFGVG